jgi:hypothetical protein
MLCDGAVAALELHVTNLAFPKVLKNAISAVTVSVAVL